MMIASDDDGIEAGSETRTEGDVSDSDVSSPAAIERAAANKNEGRMRRQKFTDMAPILGIDEAEIRSLAAAGMMMPDPYRMLMESDPMRRVQIAEVDARYRTQYTGLMVPPKAIDELVGDDPKPVRIGSKPYLKTEKSLAELMVAVRGTDKVIDAFRRGLDEQFALRSELLRLVQEKMVTARMMRHSVPSYLIDFARMMESLGCKRNDLRYVDGRVVRAVREALKLEGDDVESGADSEADRLQLWLAEDDAIASSDGDQDGESDDEFDRLSRVAASALMGGDLEAARAAFADLEAFDASLEDSFGSTGPGQADGLFADAGDGDEESVEAGPVGGPAETGNTDIAVPNVVAGDAGDGLIGLRDGVSADGVQPVRALTAEGDAGVIESSDADRDVGGSDIGGKDANAPVSPPSSDTPLPSASTTDAPVGSSTDPVPSPSITPSVIPPIPPEPRQLASGKMLTGWAVEVPKDVRFERVSGIGRLPGGDPFGGIVSTAAATPDVVPMWARVDRSPSSGDRLTIDDWYRFEVPAGPYALVHMPKKLNEYVPVRSEMFPPFDKLERYGSAAGLSQSDMRALKLAESGRGSMDIAIRAVRAVLIMTYGKDDEDLLRFWMFLLVGRRFMDRIDVLFPHGYFHGVMAPDPAAREVGTGLFRIVRVLDDGDLANQMRSPKFAPFLKDDEIQPVAG